jgi:sec-independent protein translocase protein TatC
MNSPDMGSSEEKLAEGTLISHLLELRDRLMKGMLAILLAFVPCAFYSNQIFTFVAQPLLDKLPKGATLIATSITTPFMTPFKMSFFVALFIAVPVLLYQIWAFVAPGLYRNEKRFAGPLMFSSVILFYVGVAFAYLAVMFAFFAGSAPVGVTMMPDIDAYLSFILTMFFCFGIAFEVPIAVILLATTGIVSVEKLAKSRGYVVIGIFVIAAILTPPDAVSQTIMAVPMWLLYEGGLIMARIMVKMKREQKAREEAASS